MRIRRAVLTAALVLAGYASALQSAENLTPNPDPLAALRSPDPVLQANKTLVFDMWRSIVNAGHVEMADDMLVEGYIQHSPVLRTGRKAFKEIFSAVPRRDIPELVQPPLIACIAEGNLVVMSLLERVPAAGATPSYSTTHFNLFRVDAGRLAEHWHSVHTAPGLDVPLPENGGPQPVTGFVGPDQAALLKSGDPVLARNKRLVFDMWRTIVDAGREAEARNFVDARIVDHHPGSAPGIAGIQEHFSARKDRPVQAWIRAPVVALLAEGDSVALVTMQQHPHPVHPGRMYTTTWFDLFRIADGRIVEHWDDAAPGEPAGNSVW